MKLRRVLNILILLSVVLAGCSEVDTDENKGEEIINKESPVELYLTSDSQHDQYRTRMFYTFYGVEYFDYLTESQTENNEIIEIVNITKDKNDNYKINFKLNGLGYSSVNLNYSNSSYRLRVYATTNADRLLKDVSIPFRNKEKELYVFAILQFDNGDAKHLILE